MHLSPHNKAPVDPACISHKASLACDDTDAMILPRASRVTKAEATDAIDESDEPLQPCDFIGADENQRLARVGEKRGVELLIGDRVIVHKQFTLFGNKNDERVSADH